MSIYLKILLFVLSAIFWYASWRWGENLAVSPDDFAQWLTGKLVLSTLCSWFFVAFVVSLFQKTKRKTKPMATKKKEVK